MLALPHVSSSVTTARERVRADLLRRSLSHEAVEEIVLVVSELTANALRHACPLGGGRLEIAWSVDIPWVEVAVSDGGSSRTPERAAVSVWNRDGRGLAIVERLASSWGVRDEEETTTVWASFRLPSSCIARACRKQPERGL